MSHRSDCVAAAHLVEAEKALLHMFDGWNPTSRNWKNHRAEPTCINPEDLRRRLGSWLSRQLVSWIRCGWNSRSGVKCKNTEWCRALHTNASTSTYMQPLMCEGVCLVAGVVTEVCWSQAASHHSSWLTCHKGPGSDSRSVQAVSHASSHLILSPSVFLTLRSRQPAGGIF